MSRQNFPVEHLRYCIWSGEPICSIGRDHFVREEPTVDGGQDKWRKGSRQVPLAADTCFNVLGNNLAYQHNSPVCQASNAS